jgi:hypothetical protein
MNRSATFCFVGILSPALAAAQPAPAGSGSAAAPAVPSAQDAAIAVQETGPATDDEPSAADQRTEEMAAQLEVLDARLKMAESSRKSRFPIKIGGYGDLGFFATQGDGSGVRRDAGHLLFPDRSMYGWVFYGDLLAPTVNSRGDVADLGDLPGVDRFDSVHSRGNPTFLVNELNLSVNAGLGDSALFTSSVNFTPRTGANFSLGDYFDVDLAQLEWMPTADQKTSIFVGKVDSVIGIEYKTRKAQQKFGITPTLVARYTTGTAVGVKARSKLVDDKIILAAAVTNGSFGTEQFHFFDEVDSNAFKTLSGRAALRLPIFGTLEIGASGQFGTEDGAPTGAGALWFVGVDAEADMGRVDIKAQWLKGHGPGDPVSMTYGLDLHQGGYVEADVIVTPLIGLLGRAEMRDADVWQNMDRFYATKNWRAVGGFRLLFSPNAVVKAEYLHNGEYGGTPSIPDDVVTTSAVIAF